MSYSVKNALNIRNFKCAKLCSHKRDQRVYEHIFDVSLQYF